MEYCYLSLPLVISFMRAGICCFISVYTPWKGKIRTTRMLIALCNDRRLTVWEIETPAKEDADKIWQRIIPKVYFLPAPMVLGCFTLLTVPFKSKQTLKTKLPHFTLSLKWQWSLNPQNKKALSKAVLQNWVKFQKSCSQILNPSS